MEGGNSRGGGNTLSSFPLFPCRPMHENGGEGGSLLPSCESACGMWWEEEGRGNDTRNLLGVMASSSGRQPVNRHSTLMMGRREGRRRRQRQHIKKNVIVITQVH